MGHGEGERGGSTRMLRRIYVEAESGTGAMRRLQRAEGERLLGLAQEALATNHDVLAWFGPWVEPS